MSTARQRLVTATRIEQAVPRRKRPQDGTNAPLDVFVRSLKTRGAFHTRLGHKLGERLSLSRMDKALSKDDVHPT